MNNHNVKVAQNPFQTSGHIFVKPKDPVMKEQRTNAIYSIPCNDCDDEYIGHTKRQFGTRLKEHQNAKKKIQLCRSTHNNLTTIKLGGISLKLSPLIDVTTSAFV